SRKFAGLTLKPVCKPSTERKAIFATVPRQPACTAAMLRVFGSIIRIGTQSAVRTPIRSAGSLEIRASPSRQRSANPCAFHTCAECTWRSVIAGWLARNSEACRVENPCSTSRTLRRGYSGKCRCCPYGNPGTRRICRSPDRDQLLGAHGLLDLSNHYAAFEVFEHVFLQPDIGGFSDQVRRIVDLVL